MNERIEQEILALTRMAARSSGDPSTCVGCGEITPRKEYVVQIIGRSGDQGFEHVVQRICEPCSVARFEGGDLNGEKM